MLDHEVDHGAATVRPGVQVQSDAVRCYLDEPSRLGDDRFRAFGAGVEHVGRIAGPDSKKEDRYEEESIRILLSLSPMILPVVRSHVDLVSRAAQQILQSVLLNGGADLRRVPVAEFRLVVDRVSVDRCVVGRMGSHFHRQRVGRGGGEGDLRRVRRS